MLTETGMTRPYSVSVAAEAVAVTVNSAGRLRHRREQMRRMIQMHQAQQTLDDRETVVGDGGTDGREHRGPAVADERIGHQGETRCQRRSERRGDTGVVGDVLGIPVDGHRRGVVMNRWQRIRTVDAGRDREDRAHRRRTRPRR